MKLNEGKTGKIYRVEDIDLDIKAKRRLEILGMTNQAEVKVLNSKKSGTKIIKVRGTRFAIGSDFAKKIEVQEGEGKGL